MRRTDCSTMSGVPVEPVYGPADGERPGRYPFTVKGKYGQVARTREAALFLYAPDN